MLRSFWIACERRLPIGHPAGISEVDSPRARQYRFSVGTFRKIRPAAWVILLGTLAVMVLIVVLPDVDLLDTAFHRNTSPLGIHARYTSAQAATFVVSNLGGNVALPLSRPFAYHGEFAVEPTHGLLTILDSSLRC